MRRLFLVVLVAAATVVVIGAARPHLNAAAPPSPPSTSDEAPIGVPPAETGTGDTAHLDSALKRSLAQATEDARNDGIELKVNSGWRSRAHQARLYADAVTKYGSAAEARTWVLPPDESNHVKGTAVDVGPPNAAAWLKANGERYGLCQRYANEPWHFERLAGAKGSTCPAMEPHA